MKHFLNFSVSPAIRHLLFAALLLPFFLFSCKTDDETDTPQPEPSSAKGILVFYPPDGLGDNSYMDSLCYGAHTTALEHNITQYDICPTDWEQARVQTVFFMSLFAKDDSTNGGDGEEEAPTLFIFADAGYLPFLEQFADDISKNVTLLVFESKESDLDFLSTVYMPLYGASYLAGAASDAGLSAHPYLAATPTVLETDEHADILWFWSGHGANRSGNSTLGQFVWNGKGSAGFTTELMPRRLARL
mgnify:CR=1 FL=1